MHPASRGRRQHDAGSDESGSGCVGDEELHDRHMDFVGQVSAKEFRVYLFSAFNQEPVYSSFAEIVEQEDEIDILAERGDDSEAAQRGTQLLRRSVRAVHDLVTLGGPDAEVRGDVAAAGDEDPQEFRRETGPTRPGLRGAAGT